MVSSSVSNKSCGTAILVRDTHKVNKVIRDKEGRFVQVHLEAEEHLLSFVSLYAPNKNPERNRFFSSVPELIDLSRPTFICGDFNSVLDSALDRKRRSSYTGSQAAQYQESGPALQSLLSATQTYPLWRTLHQGQTAYSWTHGSGQFASRIDMVWAPTVFQDNIKECEYHPSFFSDHSYLLVKFELEQDFRGPGVWKFNNSLLDDPEYCDLVASFWSFWQSREGSEEYSSLLDWWDQGKYYLREVTRTFSKAKAEDGRSRKSSLTRQMHNLQRLFEAGDSSAFAQLCQVQEDLRAIALHEARGAQTRARCQWALEGESSSSYFFGLEAKHQA